MALTILDTKGNPVPWSLNKWINVGEPIKMDELYKNTLIVYLNHYKSKRTVAEKLKISERTLFRMIKTYKIQTNY